MIKKRDLVAQKEVLRDLVLTHGGRMRKSDIRNTSKFTGWEWEEIYKMVYSLRKENRGHIGRYGQEAWEVLGDDVIGLESQLTIDERNKISKRTHARQEGSSVQTVQQNLIFRGRVRQELNNVTDLIKRLEASTRDLGNVKISSANVQETLFQKKDIFLKALEDAIKSIKEQQNG